MKPIDHFNLRSFDLNLLIAFDALVSERSVTKAARRLRIQQPAMSHALATLRMLLDDDVLVRTGAVMQPTAKASTMASHVAELLRQAQHILMSEEQFDPATEQRIFRFGFSSELEVFLMPKLTAYLQRHAPGIRLLSRGSPRVRSIHYWIRGRWISQLGVLISVWNAIVGYRCMSSLSSAASTRS